MASDKIEIVSAETENKWLGWLLGLLLVFGAVIGTFGRLTLGWLWIQALGPDLLVVAGVVAYFMQAADAPKARGFIAGLGMLVLIGYVSQSVAMAFGQGAIFVDSLKSLAGQFRPNIVLVQNTGQYDDTKYNVNSYLESIPWQLFIAATLTALSYLGVRIAQKKVNIPFHASMLVVSLCIVLFYFWATSRIDAQTSLATNNIFLMGILLSGYWAKVVDVLVLPALGWVTKSASRVEKLAVDVMIAPVLLWVMALAVPVSFGFMVYYVNSTALTMSIAFKIMTQGYIVGALLSGAIRELYLISRLYKKPARSGYQELDSTLELLK